MKQVLICYGTTSGNTKYVAELICKKISSIGIDTDLYDISEFDPSEFDDYEIIILGTSTWGNGELQDDWQNFINRNPVCEGLMNKKVAIFGLGDQYSYPTTFVDGMIDLYNFAVASGAKIVGEVNPSDYEFEESKAILAGNFVGLPLDEDNESSKTEKRIEDWINTIFNK